VIDSHTNRHAQNIIFDRQADRQTCRQIDKQTDRHRDKQTEPLTSIQSDMQTVMYRERQMSRQIYFSNDETQY